jgi:hypothetical protein
LELGSGFWIAALICELDGFMVYRMKSKQLANVLIKCLGLSMCLYAIPSVFSLLIPIAPFWFTIAGPSTFHDTMLHQMIANAVSQAARIVVEIGLGLFIIVKSRKIAEFWFKNEDE